MTNTGELMIINSAYFKNSSEKTKQMIMFMKENYNENIYGSISAYINNNFNGDYDKMLEEYIAKRIYKGKAVNEIVEGVKELFGVAFNKCKDKAIEGSINNLSHKHREVFLGQNDNVSRKVIQLYIGFNLEESAYCYGLKFKENEKKFYGVDSGINTKTQLVSLAIYEALNKLKEPCFVDVHVRTGCLADMLKSEIKEENQTQKNRVYLLQDMLKNTNHKLYFNNREEYESLYKENIEGYLMGLKEFYNK